MIQQQDSEWFCGLCCESLCRELWVEQDTNSVTYADVLLNFNQKDWASWIHPRKASLTMWCWSPTETSLLWATNRKTAVFKNIVKVLEVAEGWTFMKGLTLHKTFWLIWKWYLLFWKFHFYLKEWLFTKNWCFMKMTHVLSSLKLCCPHGQFLQVCVDDVCDGCWWLWSMLLPEAMLMPAGHPAIMWMPCTAKWDHVDVCGPRCLQGPCLWSYCNGDHVPGLCSLQKPSGSPSSMFPLTGKSEESSLAMISMTSDAQLYRWFLWRPLPPA